MANIFRSSTLWIFSSYASAAFTIINLAWLIEMMINAHIQRQELASYVKNSNWKNDLRFSFGLSLTAFIAIWLPNIISNFGAEIYFIALACYGLEIFFLFDLYKVLKKDIKESWFLRSALVAIIIAIISALIIVLFYYASNIAYDSILG